ncbi:MAG: SpoIIE family protein phosphatase [Candidatus Margulisbacteria bacterium]|nr:SpoIIE family protein phosphatase [Candidatus Margulisiibacteriota bacterium]
MNNNYLEKLYFLKKNFENVKSEEDLVSIVLQFIKQEQLTSPLIALVTNSNTGSSVLYGISEFTVNELNSVKDQLVQYIEEQSGLALRSKQLTIFVEERITEPKPFHMNMLKVIPMVLESKLHGAMLIYNEIDFFQNHDLYHLYHILLWLFQEKYFIIARKHQELLYKKLEVINEAREMIYSLVNMDDMLSILGDIILKHAKAEMGFLTLMSTNTDKLEVRASWHTRNEQTAEYMSNFERDFPDNLISIELEDKGNMLEYIKDEMRILKLDSVKIVKNDNPDIVDIIIPELLFIPLIIRENVIGYLGLIRKNFFKEKFNDNDISIIETIVSLAAASIENNRLYDQSLKEQMTQKELQVARNIQEGLQAKFKPALQNFDIAATSFPARVIGGDYFDFFQLDENLLGVTLTDIVGKGIPAALIMAFFKGIMQSSVFDNKEAHAVFEKISDNLVKNKSVKNYIPSVYAIIDNANRTLTYTNAGHENPFFYRNSDNSFHVLEEGGFPLGAFSNAKYGKETYVMEPGDIAILFTDGITEARNRLEDSYGEERFRALITKNKHLGAQEIVDKIVEDILLFSQDAPLHDDFTVIIIKRV